MRYRFTYYLMVLFVFLTLPGFAQQEITITGKVIDSLDGTGIPGVSVLIKGTTKGTQTDAAGNYSLTAPADGTLTFSFISYGRQEIPINNQTTINVSLASANELLDQVVVIGYGTQKKADLTGSIARVSTEDITKQPALNALQSVQGKVSGINIVSNDAPGSSPTVIVRGLGTALGGRNPLYIVDGFPVDNINNINAADIVSMDILKDASSASIYGLRAANGVILVTTKQGQAGKTKISFDSYFGVKDILNSVKMANAEQYTEFYNQNLETLGETWRLAPNQSTNTDWYDEIIKTGMVANNVLSLSGGSESIDYFFSYNNFDEKGILDGAKFNRNTIRNNNTYKLFNNKLKLTSTMNVSFTKETPKPNGAFDAAYRQSPLVPVFYDNGRYGQSFVNQTTGQVTYQAAPGDGVGSLNSIGNPVYEVNRYNQLNRTVTLQGGINGEYQINDWLKFNSRFGVTKFYSKGRGFTDIRDGWLQADPRRTNEEFDVLKAQNPGGVNYAYNSLNINNIETFRWIWENFLSFQKSFGKHNLDATLGTSREKFGIGNTISSTGYDVPQQEQYWNINLASSDYTKQVNQTNYTPTALVSYFGRVQYNYDSRYYLTATLRRDGSSVFRANNNYWGWFPSFGAGWTISNEEFMKDFTALSFLKLRATWGELGNQNIPLNVSQTLTNPGTSNNNYNYVFGPGQDLIFGAALGTPALPLSWEVTREIGAGIDFAFLNNKLDGSIDYYNKTNTNAILNVVPTLNSPFPTNYYAHGAKVVNNGLEVSLNWGDDISDDLSYNIGVNYSYNNNKVTDVQPSFDRATGGSLGNGQITKQLRDGQPLYGWWLFEADGVWQNTEEINSSPRIGSPIPGHLKYKDQNGDGLIDDRDKVFFGTYLPTSTYGINIGVNYKKFDFSVYGYGVAGNKIYNGLVNTRINGGENIAYDTYNNRWTGENSTNTDPGAARDAYASSYYLESGAYFRINNITLGYTIDKLFKSPSSLRVYVTGQNPFIFTKYSGFSPEISGYSTDANQSGSPSGTTGIELSAYPSTRNFILGLNLQF